MNSERRISEKLPTKERQWESPSIKEIRERRNNFQDNQTEIINFFRLLLSQKITEKIPNFDFDDAKKLFQSMQLSNPDLVDMEKPYKFVLEQTESLRDLKPTQAERKRHDTASEKWRSFPSSAGGSDSEGYFQTPRLHISGAGTFFTNRYRAPGKPPMKIENIEYRINLALKQDVSTVRVLMDLYEVLLQNKTLAEKGFQMKSLANNRTDAIIIYCGEQGATPIITEVGNYCLKEDLGNSPGVPFGAMPLTKNGRPLPGLRITSDPDLRDRQAYTFNDLQVTVLTGAYEKITREFLEFIGSPHTFEDADQQDLQKLHEHLAIKDKYLIDIIEEEYASALKEICGEGANLNNLAFPVIK